MAERTVGGPPRTTAEITPAPATGGSTRPDTPDPATPAARGRVVRRGPGYGGLIGAVLFFCLSLTPSLLPRSWLLQGVLGGLAAVLGYGLGAAVGWAGRGLVRWRPSARGRRRAWTVLVAVSVVLLGVFLWLGARWQADVRALMGMDRYVAWSALGIVLVGVPVFGLLLLLARAIRLGTRTLGRGLARFVARPVAVAVGVAVAAVLVLGFVQGFLFTAFVEGANRASSLTNGTTSVDARQPTSSSISGGPGSLVAWDTLGFQGRDFTGRAPTLEELAAFTGRPAVQPIRVYVGLDSAGSVPERAQLAVRELERTGAFDREVLAVMTSTGTGWIDPQTADALEFLHGGDTAEVSMQYSYLPSWISFLVDRSKAADASAALNDAVIARWRALPVDARPKLVVFGESLGSFGTEEAYSRLSALTGETDGALLVGPPNANPIWRTLLRDREPDSPVWRPVYEQGRVVRFANTPPDLAEPAAPWPGPRVVYFQNGSDPVVWWSPDLLLHRPAWLEGERAADVSPRMGWYPVVTFCQLLVDLIFANDVPAGHGHRYGTAPVAGWAAIVPPHGWTAADTARLTDQMATRPT